MNKLISKEANLEIRLQELKDRKEIYKSIGKQKEVEKLEEKIKETKRNYVSEVLMNKWSSNPKQTC